METLWRRQNRLENVELLPYYGADIIDPISTYNGVMDQIFKLKNPKSLFLNVSGDWQMEFTAASLLLQKFASIHELKVDFRTLRRNPLTAADLEGDEVAECLFAHMKPFRDWRKCALKDKSNIVSLTLKGVNLRQTKKGVGSILNLAVLTKVDLFNCSAPDQIFIALQKNAEKSGLPRLQNLKVIDMERAGPDTLVETLSGYLHSVKDCLTDLSIVLRGYTSLPAHRAILNHSRTLKRLVVDVSSRFLEYGMTDDSVHYTIQEWRELCADLDLVQVGVPFPRLEFSESYSYGCKGYEFPHYWVCLTQSFCHLSFAD